MVRRSRGTRVLALQALRLLIATVVVHAAPPAAGATIRVASLNLLDGVGSPGSTPYIAVSNLLVRIDADVVAFQEVRETDGPALSQLAEATGYPTVCVGGIGSFAAHLRNAVLSRQPVVETADVVSPPGAVEIARLPLYARIAAPGAATDLHLFVVHFKSGTDDADRFRRAIEAQRVREAVSAHAPAPDAEVVVIGDCNDDEDRYQPISFAAPPPDLPASYRLGDDVSFPVAYRAFPSDAFAAADLAPLHAPQQNRTADWTWSGYELTRRFDYVLAAVPIRDRPGTAAEAYNSTLDGAWPGLAKSGSPLPPSTSVEASDHLVVFADLELADAVVSGSPRFVAASVSANSIVLAFRHDDANGAETYRLEAMPGISGGPWAILNAALAEPDGDGIRRFTTSVPGSVRRYRVSASTQ